MLAAAVKKKTNTRHAVPDTIPLRKSGGNAIILKPSAKILSCLIPCSVSRKLDDVARAHANAMLETPATRCIHLVERKKNERNERDTNIAKCHRCAKDV